MTAHRGLWWKWLLLTCIAGGLGGVALSLGSVLNPHVLPTLYGFVAGAEAISELSDLDRVMFNTAIAVGGGLQTGTCVIIGYMACIPLRRGERWAWWACVLGLAAWLLLDTGVTVGYMMSGYPGLWPKVVNDACFVVIFGIPYVALYRTCSNQT